VVILYNVAPELDELGVRAARGFPPIQRPTKQATLRRAKPQKRQAPVFFLRYPRAVPQLEELIDNRRRTPRTFSDSVAAELFANSADLER
jgi:hypothetical protein